MKIEIFPDADAIARSRLLSVQTDGVPPPTGIKVHNSTDFLFSVSQSEYWGMAEKYFMPPTTCLHGDGLYVSECISGPCRGRTYGSLFKSPGESLPENTQHEESLAISEA